MSEVNLGAKLQDARIVCGGNSAKIAGINAAAGILELSVIEDIECFEAKLQQLRFDEVGVLYQCHVPVVQARAMKEATFGIPDLFVA